MVNNEDFGGMVVVFICTCIFLLLGIVLLFFLSGCEPAPMHIESIPTKSFRSVQVVRVIDGDTLVVNLPGNLPDVFGHEIPVRVRHIDAASLDTADKCESEMAIKAKNAVVTLLKDAKAVDIENVDRDKYFRLLGEPVLYFNNKIVPLVAYLVENKYVVPYEGGTKIKTNWCNLKWGL